VFFIFSNTSEIKIAVGFFQFSLERDRFWYRFFGEWLGLGEVVGLDRGVSLDGLDGVLQVE